MAVGETGKVVNYTDIAKQAPRCFGCGDPADGTIVLAHRNRNAWGLLFGRGSKGLSLLGAFLCFSCHAYGDSAEGRKDSDFWELAIARSQTWAWQQGYLRFLPSGGEPDERLR